ncbi:MAG: PIN domain-containing protein [Cyanobacteria bacterium J06621_8]
MTENKKGKQNEYDMFMANTVFPEAESIFSINNQPLGTIKAQALIVLDTNALLVPYNIGKESLNQIETTYKQLAQTGRLMVPGQVAREFANNRTKKILDLFQKLNRKRNSIESLKIEKYPLLESFSEYQSALEIESEINKKLKDYRKSIAGILEKIRSWNWDDPVSQLYAELFTDGVVFDPNLDKNKMQEELLRRNLHKLPPGYKDSSKNDSGIGDLVIWFTILEASKSKEKDVIFVSGDQKSDWWHRVENQALYPRYELVDEFRRESNGFSLHIITFANFLNLYGATKDIVKEVRDEENKITGNTLHGKFLYNFISRNHLIWTFLDKYLILEKAIENLFKAHDYSSYSKLIGMSDNRMLYQVNILSSDNIVDGELTNRIYKLIRIRDNIYHDNNISKAFLEKDSLVLIQSGIIDLNEVIQAIQGIDIGNI